MSCFVHTHTHTRAKTKIGFDQLNKFLLSSNMRERETETETETNELFCNHVIVSIGTWGKQILVELLFIFSFF